MKILGCDFHPSFQQIAICDLETGEVQERKLSYADGQAERFYRELGEPVLIGIEATGNCQWFHRLVQRLGHEIRVGDAAKHTRDGAGKNCHMRASLVAPRSAGPDRSVTQCVGIVSS